MSALKSASRFAAAAGLSLAGAFPAVAALPKDINIALSEDMPAQCGGGLRYVFKPFNSMIANHPVFFDCASGIDITASCRAVFEAWTYNDMMAKLGENGADLKARVFSTALETACHP